jgi:hypothetical protein
MLPVKLVCQQENVRITGAQVNDYILSHGGQKEISDPLNIEDVQLLDIVRANNSDTRLFHNYVQEVPSKTVVNAKHLDRQPKLIKEYKIPDKECLIASCPHCNESAEITTIPDPSSQNTVLLPE